MENASKALIMAGEILIALLIIALLVFGFTKISNLSETKQGTIEAEQLAAFNKQYESYNRKLLRGVDVISLINKAIDNNKRYDNEEYYKINVEFSMAETTVYVMNNGDKDDKRWKKTTKTFKKEGKYTFDSYMEIVNDEEAFTDFKRRVFDCEEIRYNKDSGRINYMYFKERKLSTNGYELDNTRK